MKYPLKNQIPALPPINHVGDFAYRRSFYHHPGIDLYCPNMQHIVAIEDGIVIKYEQFTGQGADPPSPWWNDTWSILIEGKSGVIGYCELIGTYEMKVGLQVTEGQVIGGIIPVLKKDKGNGTTMLHLEHYVHGTKDHVTWVLDEPKPEQLLNPRELLEKIII